MNEYIESLSPASIWFLIGILLFLLEISSPGFFLFFFGIGAWLTALFCATIDIPTYLQLLIFTISSLSSLLILRKKMRSIFDGKSDDKQAQVKADENFIGKRVLVISDIKSQQTGRIELNGTSWMAEAEEDIATGTQVEVIGKTNLTIKVKRV